MKKQKSKLKNHPLDIDTKFRIPEPKAVESQALKIYFTILGMLSRKKGKIFKKNLSKISFSKNLSLNDFIESADKVALLIIAYFIYSAHSKLLILAIVILLCTNYKKIKF